MTPLQRYVLQNIVVAALGGVAGGTVGYFHGPMWLVVMSCGIVGIVGGLAIDSAPLVAWWRNRK